MQSSTLRHSLLVFIAVAALFVTGRTARAVPQFAAQAGRTCDNCHIIPDWDTPKLAHRKRNMSCQSCHVDPAGGGLRTTAGRYFGRASLPMIAWSPRPQDDWDHNLPFIGRRDKVTPYDSYMPIGPRNIEQAQAYTDSISDQLAWGVHEKLIPTAPWPGRYFGLNPDPFLRVGGDLRLGFLAAGSALIFPMQLDIATAVHPVHHVTALMAVGARGQSSGYSDTFDDSHTPYFRDLFVMTSEWPYQAYVKAGRFMPNYGLRLDDHTTRTRREFELDNSLPESRVLGVEAGAVAAYPFIHASYFKMKSKFEEPDPWDISDVDDGWGAALNLGWRDLAWSLGSSYLTRRRPLDEGGDTDTYGVYGSFNPWYFSMKVPLTLQGEIDYGTLQRASGLEASKLAAYGELDWMAWNGVVVLLAYDWSDPDRDVVDDDSGRVQVGGQFTVIPGVTLDMRVRYLHVATSSGSEADFFSQLH
ncbi:MAG TPA: hypothetical protein VF247_05510, partial [Candidatus Krumholzibacteria bacterium]